jgi:hypothetical protein
MLVIAQHSPPGMVITVHVFVDLLLYLSNFLLNFRNSNGVSPNLSMFDSWYSVSSVFRRGTSSAIDVSIAAVHGTIVHVGDAFILAMIVATSLLSVMIWRWRTEILLPVVVLFVITLTILIVVDLVVSFSIRNSTISYIGHGFKVCVVFAIFVDMNVQYIDTICKVYRLREKIGRVKVSVVVEIYSCPKHAGEIRVVFYCYHVLAFLQMFPYLKSNASGI